MEAVELYVEAVKQKAASDGGARSKKAQEESDRRLPLHMRETAFQTLGRKCSAAVTGKSISP